MTELINYRYIEMLISAPWFSFVSFHMNEIINHSPGMTNHDLI